MQELVSGPTGINVTESSLGHWPQIPFHIIHLNYLETPVSFIRTMEDKDKTCGSRALIGSHNSMCIRDNSINSHFSKSKNVNYKNFIIVPNIIIKKGWSSGPSGRVVCLALLI